MAKQEQTALRSDAEQAGIRHGLPESRILLDDSALPARTMLGAMAQASRLNQPVTQVLVAEGLISQESILSAQAERYGALSLRAGSNATDDTALSRLPATFCLEHAVLPWMFIGETLVLATSRPEKFAALHDLLPDNIGPVIMAVTLDQDIHQIIADRHGTALARAAETMRPQEDSCRDLANVEGRSALWAAACLAIFLTGLWIAPKILFALALSLALGSLVIAQIMKLAALLATWRRTPPPASVPLPPAPPVVSILVPLFNERNIARELLARLSRLSYPKSLLDIVLVLEAEDSQTRLALDEVRLPAWIRRVEVPPGQPMTKPRAMNYALRFTRGDIIGIFDAEDSPAADQIDRVVARFAQVPEEVACLQGILDYYNPKANWLSRCFAIEYASWFRVLLPGLSRLGFAVPLGGTTVYFRRHALFDVGGWDAHNVTEDADLGILLARRGYRTELIRSVTREEANNRFWPWIKQRSRWLKGYAITWWVHSRRPIKLWRDLGAWGFLGMQALFLTTLVQFSLAPILWSFWMILLGLPHPLDGLLTEQTQNALIVTFLSAEAISLAFGVVALSRSPHRGLMPWVPTLFAYFPLGTLAIYKALWEVVRNPFYWDKTEHGHSAPDTPDAEHPPQV